jgi:small GTP-binding protein
MYMIQKKICLLGDFAVGKTSLVRQFVEGRFDDRYQSTIGVKISRKTLSRSYGELNMLVWDLAGDNTLKAFVNTKSYLHGTAGAMIVCDLTRFESLTTFELYARELQNMNQKIPLTFIANKVDLVAERMISNSDLRRVCASLGEETFFLSSARTGEQVEAAFRHLADQIEA